MLTITCCGRTLAFALIALALFHSHLLAADLTAIVGKQAIVMSSGQHGFNYFPDEPVNVINRLPLRFLMVVGSRTILMEGPSFESAVPSKVVLEPSKLAGAYDEHYAGISGVFIAKNRKDVLGFFHAEKPTGGNDGEGTTRFYATIGLAISHDGGNTFNKIGPILSGRPEDPEWKGTAQGNGDVSVCLDHTGQWLHAYYTEHSRQDPATGKARSVITCMARSKVTDGGKPGTWKKYFNGSFDEPGLGGKDSEVANCWAPQVTYIASLKKYVMMGSRGCVGFFTSDDGVKWQDPTVLFEMDDVPILDKEIAIHPSLYIARSSPQAASGFLFYAYSPKYGHQNPSSPHYLVKRTITFKLTDKTNAVDKLKMKLAGTKWVNSNRVSFEWTADGRFLHKGTERQWKVVDGRTVQIIFGPDHIDTLVFNEAFNEFKQLIRGGPDFFQGKPE